MAVKYVHVIYTLIVSKSMVYLASMYCQVVFTLGNFMRFY